MHAHQCGITAVGDLRAHGFGCGHLWVHPDTFEMSLHAHYCPRCRKGPFTVKVPMPTTIQNIDSYQERIERLANATRITLEEPPDPRSGDLGPIADNE